jgi:hypothetical protein
VAIGALVLEFVEFMGWLLAEGSSTIDIERAGTHLRRPQGASDCD